MFLDTVVSKAQDSTNKLSLISGTQRLFSVKYLFGEANAAYNFPLLEDALKISRCLFHSCTIFEAYLVITLRFSEV